MSDIEETTKEIMAVEGMTQQKLARLVQDKVDRIGNKYLTTEGAMFLVANDLGIKTSAGISPQRLKTATYPTCMVGSRT